MKHFYKDIQGWFGAKHLYKAVVKEFGDHSHFLEIGAWKGQSTAFLAVEIIKSKKAIRFDVVDTWQGSEEHIDSMSPAFEPILKETGTIYPIFEKNLKPVWDYIKPIISTSEDAAKQYENNSLDFIFIDGAHDYDNVIKDLTSWYPKLKLNGIIAGDDFEWPGVQKALKKFFVKNYIVHDDNNTWIHRNTPDASHEEILSGLFNKRKKFLSWFKR